MSLILGGNDYQFQRCFKETHGRRTVQKTVLHVDDRPTVAEKAGASVREALGWGHFSEMVGDPATSEAALPVTESGASEKQNSDGEGNGTRLEGNDWVPLTLALVRPLGRDWEANMIPGGSAPWS